MNNQRFVTILNEVAASMARAPLEPAAGRSEAEAIQVWAEFLRRCVEQGVPVGDPRWKALEVHRDRGRARFRLPAEGKPAPDTRDDFSVGLALLMSMLHPEDDA
ncbi:MAG TPA: hypothetical protein VF247_11330 [Candidatus Krumholzibacteria bacterium]